MPDNNDSNWGPVMGVGLTVAIGIGLGAVVGFWIDKRMGSGPWGLIIGILVGCAAGMYQLIKEVGRINRK